MTDAGFLDLLSRYPTRYHPLSPITSLGGAGGLSGSRLWRFDSENGELLLRAWPPNGRGQQEIEQIHHWLFATADLAFVPVPVRDHAGRSVQAWRGALWELTPWLAGVPDLSCPPRAEHLGRAFAGLARFHERLSSLQANGVSSGLRQRHDDINRLIAGGFDTLETAILQSGFSETFTRKAALDLGHPFAERRATLDSDPNQRQPALDLGHPFAERETALDSDADRRQKALDWLSLARTVAPLLLKPLMQASGRVIRLQPVIRDARPEHFLFDGDHLSGLVDFGAMGVDSVAADLARLAGEWLEGDATARRQALASYERIRPLDPTESALIADFEAGTALLTGERWVRWHYLEHRSFDDPLAVSRGLARGLDRLDRLVQTMAARGDLAGLAGRAH